MHITDCGCHSSFCSFCHYQLLIFCFEVFLSSWSCFSCVEEGESLINWTSPQGLGGLTREEGLTGEPGILGKDMLPGKNIFQKTKSSSSCPTDPDEDKTWNIGQVWRRWCIIAFIFHVVGFGELVGRRSRGFKMMTMTWGPWTLMLEALPLKTSLLPCVSGWMSTSQALALV